MLSAVNIPKEQAEAILLLPEDSALISIGEEHEPFWNLQVSGDRVARMVFSDVTTPTKKGDKCYNPIDGIQARALAEFIALHRHRKFIVNCRAGISRSAAICLFIHEQYGHHLKPYFWDLSHPNPWVFQSLRHAQQSMMPVPNS
jgi:predicted protein tyrosine phosphatase